MRPPATSSRRAGFSIMELMLVLVIIGVMASLIAPSVGEVVANERARSAAVDLYRLATDTKSRTEALGVVHMLQYITAGDGGLGTVAQFMGMNRSCTQTPWVQAVAPVPETSLLSARRRLLMSEYNLVDAGRTPSAGDQGRHVVRLSAQQGPLSAPTEVRICFQPNGTHFTTTNPPLPGAPVFPMLTQQALPVLFTITRSVDGVRRGVNRQVMFPVSGAARLR